MTTSSKFLQSSSGENSSKRLAFISGHFTITLASLYFINKLVLSAQYQFAVDIYNSYLIYCSVLGGYVTSELLVKVLQIIKGKK